MSKRTKTARTIAAEQDPHLNWRKLWFRAVFSLIASLGFIWLLSQRLQHIDLSLLMQGFGNVPISSWVGALAFTAASFWAVGHYDAVVHRHFNSGLPSKVAKRAGICAIAVSQTIGLGLITGSLLRWRMLPGQSLWMASRLTAAVALSFLAGWAFVTALTLTLLPEAPFRMIGALVFLTLCGAALATLIPQNRARIIPNGITLSRLFILTAIDTVTAAAALWMLCSPELELPFLTLLPVFLLAVGAGLITGAPGGVGPFEITLLALLPGTQETGLLTAVLAWRACYYALPAILGAGFAIIGAKRHDVPPVLATRQLLNLSKRAELGLALQGQHQLIAATQNCGFLVARTRHFFIGLFDPISQPSRHSLTICLRHLHDSAKSASSSFALYKASARTAAVARSLGQSCLRIAQEATLVPESYHLDCPARANLRRKLRRAQSAEVTVTQPTLLRDWTMLDQIASDWAKAHGGERGFSMGRYCHSYLNHQRLYIAWQHGTPIAFASFHIGSEEWTLDLMRHKAALPDGAMHLLIHTAITDAKSLAIPRFSLSAVPDYSRHNRFAKLISQSVDDASQGLVRFKSSFAPKWQPLYLIAPSTAGLCFAAAEIAYAIHRPMPLPLLKKPMTKHHHADIEFASDRYAWHRQTD